MLFGLSEFVGFIGLIKDRGQERLIVVFHTETQGTQRKR